MKMPGRIAAQAIETVTASGGIPIGTALLVAALTLILFGLVTAFRKAVRLISPEEVKGVFHRLLDEPARFHRRLALSQILTGIACLCWNAVFVIPVIVGLAGVNSQSAASWLTAALFILLTFLLLLFGLVVPKGGRKKSRYLCQAQLAFSCPADPSGNCA